jgi:hypothetical protein
MHATGAVLFGASRMGLRGSLQRKQRTMRPTIGRTVHYVNKTGFHVPAIILATFQDEVINLLAFTDPMFDMEPGAEQRQVRYESKISHSENTRVTNTWHWPERELEPKTELKMKEGIFLKASGSYHCPDCNTPMYHIYEPIIGVVCRNEGCPQEGKTWKAPTVFAERLESEVAQPSDVSPENAG